MEGLTKLMKGRTVITIAHRLSTIRDVEQDHRARRGVVAEQGTHDELLTLQRHIQPNCIESSTRARARRRWQP